MGSTFLIGGARSGKSTLAVRLAEQAETRRQHVTFVVTAEALDNEMVDRIDRHRAERPQTWDVIEAPRELYRTLTSGVLTTDAAAGNVLEGFLVIDCISFWVANLVMAGMQDEAIEREAAVVARLLAMRAEGSVVVSNEVGMGLVPDNELGRRFRDVLGRVNAIFASSAEAAFLIVAGRALRLSEFSLD
jgi:adenosylcobinamide kinase / adenosylcobinamide-phosphate guanylyltransferase